MEHVKKNISKVVKGLGTTKDVAEVSGLEKNLEGTCARGVRWRWGQMCSMSL